MNANWSDYEVFMKPVHLKGQAVTLTITKATEEETHPQRGKTVLSPVLWFRELPFGLILSPTNRTTLIALYGDRVSDCIGKPIVVKAVNEKVAGRDKQPIRIQNVRPNAPRVEVGTGEIVSPAESVIVSPITAPVEQSATPSSVNDPATATADLPDKKTDAPDYCKTHLATMTEKSKTGVLFHRVQVDGKTGYCDGSTVKFNGSAK